MDKKDEIVEVEVEKEKIDTPKKNDTPKKTLSDYSNKIHFYTSLALLGSKYGFSALILSSLSGFIFSILYSENHSSTMLILLIVCFSLAFISLIFYIVGLIASSLAKKYMAKDPNYSSKL
ncbi:MAG TPA: hypothetical protein DEF61_05230 [Firmicutes bacterium]|mgnify:CR=1 FL=1|nr:hypothetical protein [Bacillota bacterium]HBX25627.1 hypothetical protein [Bacillota bacterium]